jgi:hypothetical protein
MLEGIMAVSADGQPSRRSHSRGDDALRTARTCYDHLAGRLGVAVADTLTKRNLVVLDEDGGLVTPAGEDFLLGFGIATQKAGRGERAFCRPCLDWSERRFHLAGAVGAALMAHCFDLGWLTRLRDTRAVLITAKGRRGLGETFEIRL